ncbi:MAG TPA: polysaccharide biosynthesis protein [Longimicrobium sp.]|nr:polysaccharide biosynthesis protein [Longimicrobium sp.]
MMKAALDGAEVLILGGTGSLGQRLFHRILADEMGSPASVTVVSRDEAKQHAMRLELMHQTVATDDVIYNETAKPARFAIGDVRNYPDMRRYVERSDVIFHAAALKQVPTCEYHGAAAVDTNVIGAINLARAVFESRGGGKDVVGISTDKACKPVNMMGMTKAIQERILVQANLDTPGCRFVNVRYGNVMASRGSVIPFFIDLVRRGKPLPITDRRMTRFLMTLDESVDLIFRALRHANAGETYVPLLASARVTDIALAVAEAETYPMTDTGIRPGEKIQEILVSEEEVAHTVFRGDDLVILPILPELRVDEVGTRELPFAGEYTSGAAPLPLPEVRALLLRHRLTRGTAPETGEIFR